MTDCVVHVDYNTSVADTPAVGCGDVGYELWGGVGTTANGNFWSGAYMCHTIIYAPSGQFTFNNNTAYAGGSSGIAACQQSAEDSPSITPSSSGNVNRFFYRHHYQRGPRALGVWVYSYHLQYERFYSKRF